MKIIKSFLVGRGRVWASTFLFLGWSLNLVGEDPVSVPADVILETYQSEDGAYFAHATIHFIDPYHALFEAGEARLVDGRQVIIDAEAGPVVFVAPPEEPAIVELEYRLPISEDGEYEINFRINGETFAQTVIQIGDPLEGFPRIVRFSVEPRNVDWGDAATLSWEVTGADRLELLPGVGVVEGDRATVIPSDQLEPDPTDPDGSGQVNYTLVATNQKGSIRSLITVFIGEQPDPTEGRILAHLEVPPIVGVEVRHDPIRLSVIYQSTHGIDIDTLGDDDLNILWAILSPDGQHLPVPERQPQFVGADALDGAFEVEAQYEIPAPVTGWTPAWNGHHEVETRPGSVATLRERVIEQQGMGGIMIEIESSSEENPIDAELTVYQDENDNVLIEATTSSWTRSVTYWGQPRWERRDRCVIDAVSSPVFFFVEPEEPLSELHVYPLKPLGPGHYEFILTIDGRRVASAFYQIRGDDPVQHWLGEYLDELGETTPDRARAIVSADDADGDGLKDVVEWAIGSNPVESDSDSLLKPGLMARDGKKHLAVSFPRRTEQDRIDFHIEISTDLHQWKPGGDEIDQVSVDDLGSGLEKVTYCLAEPVGAAPVRFVRLRFEER